MRPDYVGRPYHTVSRHINGLAPAPAWFSHSQTRVKVLLAEPVDLPHQADPGTVLDDALTIACMGGAVFAHLATGGAQRDGCSDLLCVASRLRLGHACVNLSVLRRPVKSLAFMQRYKLTLEYDGSPFVGWQRQDNGLSVQQVLRKRLSVTVGIR